MVTFAFQVACAAPRRRLAVISSLLFSRLSCEKLLLYRVECHVFFLEVKLLILRLRVLENSTRAFE